MGWIQSSSLLGQCQSQQCQRDRCQQGLESYPARLPPDLRQFGFIFNFFHFFSQVARTLRGQGHSGFIAPLKEAGRRAPEQEQERQPPQPVGARGDEHGQDG